jgi:capsular polysaccharide biosynthesis protein
MNEKLLHSSDNLILDLYKWRKPLFIVTLIACLLAAVVSSPIVITPKFKSTSVIFPTTTNSISQALLVEHNPYRKDVLEFGEELEAERLLQILTSDEMQNRIVEEFSLFDHYEIDPTSIHAQTWIGLAFKEHFSFKRTELMSIKIEVLDKNPKMSADMSNRIVDLIDTVMARVKKERAEQAVVILEQRDASLSSRLFIIYDSLEVLRSFGVLDVSLQAERLTEYYAKAISNGNTSGARALKKEFDKLAKHGGAYFRLFEQLELVQEQLETIRLEKENIRMELDANLTHRFVINRAFPADKKSYPIRWLIVLMSGISTFLFTLVLLYFKQNLLLKDLE